MNYEIASFLLIIAVLIMNIAFYVTLIRHIDRSLWRLDKNIAEALTKTLENLPDMVSDMEIEPINPMQQMIMQIIQEKMNPQIKVTEISRSEDGKFSNQDTSLKTE